MKKALLTTVLTTSLLASSLLATLSASSVQAADYKVDVEGAHAFVQFKIKHLGYSWLLGRFNTFDGGFSYDDKSPNNAKINIDIRNNVYTLLSRTLIAMSKFEIVYGTQFASVLDLHVMLSNTYS